jgi:hypothetical protein
VRANFTIDAYTISGTVGTAGAILNYIDGTAKKVTADGSGKYTISVTGGWSGKVTPSKGGYIFSPSSKTYSSLVENKADQNYGAVEAYMTFMPLLTR